MEQFICSWIALYHWVEFEWAFKVPCALNPSISLHAQLLDRAVYTVGLSPHVIAAEFIVFVRFSETVGP
tara:strand:- start:1029 stop:1235 length:207 start_codon:yes stop_codon:yes gene_type:complete